MPTWHSSYRLENIGEALEEQGAAIALVMERLVGLEESISSGHFFHAEADNM